MNEEAKASISSPAVLTAAGVARLLNLTDGYFRNRRAELEAFGFPKKLPGLNAWSKAAVMRWIATNGETYLPGKAEAQIGAADERLEISVATRALEDEYAGGRP